MLILALVSILTAHAAEYHWELDTTWASPDCVEREVITINGNYVGPEIRVAPGEEIIVHVTNKMPFQSISLHWHGMTNQDNFWNEGVAMVTECPIPPYTSKTYTFYANDKPMSTFYHAHLSGMRGAGAIGPLIVEGDFAENDGEHTVFIADWYHTPISELTTGLMEPAFRWAGDPQSVLINGVGVFDCDDNVMYTCDDTGDNCLDSGDRPVAGASERPHYTPHYHPNNRCTSNCQSLTEYAVTTGQKYFFRFINAGALSMFNAAIEGHTMTVVEADGMPVQPFDVTSVDLNSGQRVGVIVEMNQTPGVYIVRVNTRGRSGIRTGNAYLVYDGMADRPDPSTVTIDMPAWDDYVFMADFQNSLKGVDAPPPATEDVTRTFEFVTTQERFDWANGVQSNGVPSSTSIVDAIGEGDNRPENNCDSNDNTWNLRWAVGRTSFKIPSTPAAQALYFGIDSDEFTESNNYYHLEKDGVYDVVVNNYPACNGVCEQHGWHMHGHKFWILGSGPGTWTGSDEQIAALNTVDPPKRDTFITVPDETRPPRDGCGYTVIRFIASNPGVWYFHCHQSWHILMGMNAAFVTSFNEVGPPPDTHVCGDMTSEAFVKNETPKEPEASGATQTYHFEIDTTYTKPDCVERESLTINGELIGPEIVAQPGELIEVTVTNKMPFNAIGIHWHGIEHVNNNWQDGVSMVTECPLAPFTTKTYTFRVNEHAGSYFYHAHLSGIRGAGVIGPLIIEGQVGETEYENDFTVLSVDWYHTPMEQIVAGLLEPRFRWPGDPHSVLTNGKGYFDCTSNSVYQCAGVDSEEVCTQGGSEIFRPDTRPHHIPHYHPQNSCVDCGDLEEFVVESGKTYLFRFINSGSISFFNSAFEGHTMTIVAADGIPVVPFEVTSVDYNSGQRVDVLVTMDQPEGIYVMRTNTRGRSGVRTGHAYLVYSGAADQARPDPFAAVIEQPTYDDSQFTRDQQASYQGYSSVPPSSDVLREFQFVGTQERFNTANGEYVKSSANVDDVVAAIGEGADRPENNCDSHDNTYNLRWAVGRRSFKLPSTPALQALKYNVGDEILDESRGYYYLEKDGVYDIVLQNYPACNGVCETHGWHMHGHDFFVLGHGMGLWTGSDEQKASLNLENPPLRDSIMVINDEHHPAEAGGCGWTVIRFTANNPGVWYFHCHQAWHVIMGMNAAFVTAIDEVSDPPEGMDTCGAITAQVVEDAKAVDEETDHTPDTSVPDMYDMQLLSGDVGSVGDIVADPMVVEVLSSNHVWVESPLVVDGMLYFSDVKVAEFSEDGYTTGAIYMVDPEAEVPTTSVFLEESGVAGADDMMVSTAVYGDQDFNGWIELGSNGLEYKDGMMIVCQHGAQRIVTFSMDAVVDGRVADSDVTVLVDSYDGKSLNAPNDMFLMGDMLFFTDPPYGLQGGQNPDGSNRDAKALAPQGTFQVFCYDMVTGDLSVVIDLADVGTGVTPNGLLAKMMDDGSMRMVVGRTEPSAALLVFDDATGTGSSLTLTETILTDGTDGAIGTTPENSDFFVFCDGMTLHNDVIFASCSGGVRLVDINTLDYLGQVYTNNLNSNNYVADGWLYMTANTDVVRVKLAVTADSTSAESTDEPIAGETTSEETTEEPVVVTPSDSSDSSISTTTVIIIIVAIVVALVIIGVAAFYYLSSSKMEAEVKRQPEQKLDAGGSAFDP